MKNLQTYKLLALLTVLVFSCDVPIQLDPEQTPPIPVIEAVLTDVEGKNYVKITETVPFYYEGKLPYRDDAAVILQDNEGNIVIFTPYQGNNSDSLGYYLPPVGYKGTVGRSYRLDVFIDGEIYTAIDQMVPVAPIDSLTVNLDVFESIDPEEAGRFYEVLIFAQEPEETKDFYLFKFYRNDKIERAFDTDIYVVDDLFLSINISGIPVPFYYAEGDTAVVEMYGISSNAYIYYQELQFALANDGGLFSPPPANPKTNFSLYTPGYFLVASVATQSIVIE